MRIVENDKHLGLLLVVDDRVVAVRRTRTSGLYRWHDVSLIARSIVAGQDATLVDVFEACRIRNGVRILGRILEVECEVDASTVDDRCTVNYPRMSRLI